MTRLRSVSPFWRCLARTLPITTGFTASRCEGLAVSERWIWRPSGRMRSVEVPEMVLHVARAQDVVDHRRPLELGEDRGIGLAHDVGQDVEPAAVRHAEDDVVDAELGAGADDRLEAGMALSPPSRPKRLVPGNLTCRNCSKPSVSVRCSRISRLLLGGGVEQRRPCPRCAPGSRPSARGPGCAGTRCRPCRCRSCCRISTIGRKVAFSRPRTKSR